jgi:WD40 repeat protein
MSLSFFLLSVFLSLALCFVTMTSCAVCYVCRLQFALKTERAAAQSAFANGSPGAVAAASAAFPAASTTAEAGFSSQPPPSAASSLHLASAPVFTATTVSSAPMAAQAATSSEPVLSSVHVVSSASIAVAATAAAATATDMTVLVTSSANSSSSSSSAGDSMNSLAPSLTVAELSFLVTSSTAASSPGTDGAVATPVNGWRSAAVLRSHVDGVRSVAFHPTDPWLVSASEDGTAKIWQLGSIIKVRFARPCECMDVIRSMGCQTVGSCVVFMHGCCFLQNGRGNDDAKVIEPLFTYRGHRGPIFTTAFSGTDQPGMSGLVATAGSDSVVCVWRLPPPKQELYGSFGKVSHLRLAALTGHTDAVWGLAWIPSTGRLVSAAADGCINAWTVRH